MRPLDEQRKFLAAFLGERFGARFAEPGDQAEIAITALPLQRTAEEILPGCEMLNFEMLVEREWSEEAREFETFRDAVRECFAREGYRVVEHETAVPGFIFAFLLGSEDSQGFVFVGTGTPLPNVRLASVMLGQLLP